MIKNLVAFTNSCAQGIEPSRFKEEWVKTFEGKAPPGVLAAIATLRACRARQGPTGTGFTPTEAEFRAGGKARQTVLQELKSRFPAVRLRTLSGSSC
jgi:hypothetical protein